MKRWMGAAVLVWVVGCGPAGPEVVGGACEVDEQCVDSCLEGRDYPGGMCSIPCRDDLDCPEFSWCVDRSGGFCLPACEVDRDCPPDYECRDTDREGAGGRVEVCRGR